MHKVAIELDRPSHLYRLDEEAEFTFRGSGRYVGSLSPHCLKHLGSVNYCTDGHDDPKKVAAGADDPWGAASYQVDGVQT